MSGISIFLLRRLPNAIKRDLVANAQMAEITYEALARESRSLEVTSLFIQKAMEARWLARFIADEPNDMATPSRYA